MDTLCAYGWPGNVRELENVVERACVLCEGHVIRVVDLPASLQVCVPSISPASLTAAVETEPASLLPPSGESIYPLNNPVNSKPKSTPASQGVEPLKDFLRDQELVYLNRALAQAGGDKEKAASLLGISLATLYRKLAGDEGN